MDSAGVRVARITSQSALVVGWEHNMRVGIVIGIVFASYTSSISADEYKDATDAAYCIGVFESDIDYWKSLDALSVRSASDIRDAKQKKIRKEAFVEGAIKQGKIDLDTATKMKSVGNADASLCGQKINKCMDEYGERSRKKVDDALNNAEYESCKKDAKPICERAYKNCD